MTHRQRARIAPALIVLIGLHSVLTAHAWDRGVKARAALRAADRLFNKRAYREALERYRKAAQQAETSDTEELSRVQTQLGECAEKAGLYREALEAWSRALGTQLARDDRTGMAETLRRMGEAHAFLGEYEKGLRCLALGRELPGESEDAGRKARALKSLAVVRGALGDFPAQGKAAQEALVLFRKADDADGEAGCWVQLAAVSQAGGKFDEALRAIAGAQTAAKRSPNPDLAPIFLTKAGIHRARGDMRQALATDQEALEAARKGGVVEAAAVAQANLGLDAMAFGEYGRAREALEAARKTFRECGAADDVARMCLELGRLHYFQKGMTLAQAELEEARRLFEASAQPVAVAVVRAATGWVHEAQGRFAEALTEHEHALAAFRAAGERSGVAAEAVERGMVLAAMGRGAEALAALSSADAAGGEADVGWRRWQGKARVAALHGDSNAAAAHYRKAADEIEKLLVNARVPQFRSSFLGGGDRLALYDEAIELAVQSGRAGEALELAERSRARAFLDLLGAGSVNVRQGAGATLLAREKELKEHILALSRRVARTPEAPPAGQLRGLVAEPAESEMLAARAEHHALLERIAAESPALAGLVAAQPASAERLRSALAADEQALVYHIGDSAARLFLVDRRGVTVAKLSATPKELRSLAAVFRIQLEQRIPSEAMARRLYGLLIAPVEGRLRPGCLVLAPHDMLHYVPFAALIGPGGRPLGFERELRMVPSLTASAFTPARPAVAARMALVAGAPASGAPELPKATEEVRRVASLYPGATVLTGEAATEEAVRRHMETAGVIHLACHGVLEGELPLYSGLLLTPGGGEDGRLELHEIFGLRLSARLAVLSACQTALGSLSRGDELVCLSRSFLQSGCQGVLASLWSVPDESTAQLMTELHRRIAAGDRPSTALRLAAQQLAADPKFGEPYFWAAFALFGR